MTTIALRAALAAATATLAFPALAAAAPIVADIDVHTGVSPSVTARSTGAPSMYLSIRRGEANTLLQAIPMTDCGGGMKCATVPVTLGLNDRATIDVGATPQTAVMRAIVVYEGTPKISQVTCDGTISGAVGTESYWKTFEAGVVGGASGSPVVGPGGALVTAIPGGIPSGAQSVVRQSYTYDAGGQTGRISIDRTATGCTMSAPVPPPAPSDPPVQPQSPPPPAPDTVAPSGSLKLGLLPSLRTIASKGLASTITVSEPCLLTQELRLGGTLVGRGTARAAAAGSAKVTVKLSAAGRRKVRKARPARLALTTTAMDTAGNARVLDRRTVKLRG